MSEWIDEESQKPEPDEQVLVAYWTEGCQLLDIGYWCAKMGWIVGGLDLDRGSYVSHWQQLPAMPE